MVAKAILELPLQGNDGTMDAKEYLGQLKKVRCDGCVRH